MYPTCTVANVTSPGKYSVVSNDKEHVSDVKNLERRLGQEMNLQDPSRFDLDFQMFVAVIDSEGKCRRGIIEETLEDGLYEVFLIDYGLFVQVPISQLRVVTSENLMKIEPLAFFVILYGLIPTKYVTEEGIKKRRACKEWSVKSRIFVENLFKNSNKVVVQSILMQDRTVYGELFVRPNPDEKFMPLRKLLCKNEFCVYSEKIFLEQSGFMTSCENQTVEFERKMEFVRKWQRECLQYQRSSHFIFPLPVSLSGGDSPQNTSCRFSSPDSQYKSLKQTFQMFGSNEGTPGTSTSTVPKSPGKGRGRLKFLAADAKNVQQGSAFERKGDPLQRDSLKTTETKVSKGRGLLLRKFLEAKKPGSTEASFSDRNKFGENRSDIAPELEKYSDWESDWGNEKKNKGARGTWKVEKALVKPGEFLEFSDSSELTELSLSAEEGPPPLIRNRNCCREELSKTNSAIKSAESFRLGKSDSKRTQTQTQTQTLSCRADSSEILSGLESTERGQTFQEWPPKRVLAADSWTPYVVFDDSFVEPVDTFAELPIQRSVIENLENGGPFKFLSPIQRWAIPAIRKQHNVVVIGGAKTGKSLSYVIPIIDYVQDETYFEELPQGNGPSVVIVASSSSACESIFCACFLLLGYYGKDPDTLPIKVVLAHGADRETETRVSLTNSCDVLISTPHCLVRLLETPLVTNLDRLAILVLDEIDIISQNPFWKSLRIVLEKAKFNTSNRHYQKIICGEKLTQNVELVMKNYLKSYALVMGSYSEAIVHEGLRPSIYLVEQSQKPELLAEKLKNKITKLKILIVCELTLTAVSVGDFLGARGISVLLAHENMLADKLKEIQQIRKSLADSVLIATDGVLNELNVRDVQVLVHYDLPSKSKTNFYLRYSTLECFLRRSKETCTRARAENRSPQVQSIIFVDDENHYQLPHIVDFVTRLGGKISPKVRQKCEEIRRRIEVSKRDAPVCRNLLSFGLCRNERTCPRRHAFIGSLDSCGDLPTSGSVNFSVVTTRDASCFSARLIEHVDSNGETFKFENRCAEIAMNLAAVYRNEGNRRLLGTAKVGEVCAVKIEFDGLPVFYRATIVEYSKVDKYKKPLEVNVRLMEHGNVLRRKIAELYELPEELSRLPPSAVDVVVVGVQPMDWDVSWSQTANDFAESLLTQKLLENQYWSGNVELALNNILLLTSVKRKEFLPHLNTHVFDLVVENELVSNRLAVPNGEHLPALLKLCREAGIEVSEEGPKTKRESTTVRPQWAFFDSVFAQVKFLAADGTSMVFLQSRKYEKSLRDLEKECQKEGEKVALPTKTPRGESERSGFAKITVGTYCLARFDDGKWKRGRVESDNGNQFYVFFVDRGVFLFVPKADVLPISENLVLRLPFQAIECKLAEVEDSDCPLDTLKETVSLSDDLYALIVARDLNSVVTGGWKYKLILTDDRGTSLNKMLVDSRAVPAEESETHHLKRHESGEREGQVERNSFLENAPEDYLNTLPDDVFEDDDGQKFLLEFASTFFPEPRKESQPNDKDEEAACVATWNSSPTEKESKQVAELQSKVRGEKRIEFELKSRDIALTPRMLWSQDDSEVRLKVLLGGVKDYFFECTVDNVCFGCLAGDKIYELELRLYGMVDPAATKITAKTFHVLVVLRKLSFPPWPRLFQEPGKRWWVNLDVEYLPRKDGFFSDRITRARLEIEAGMLKVGTRDDDILPCSDCGDSNTSGEDSTSEDD